MKHRGLIAAKELRCRTHLHSLFPCGVFEHHFLSVIMLRHDVRQLFLKGHKSHICALIKRKCYCPVSAGHNLKYGLIPPGPCCFHNCSFDLHNINGYEHLNQGTKPDSQHFDETMRNCHEGGFLDRGYLFSWLFNWLNGLIVNIQKYRP